MTVSAADDVDFHPYDVELNADPFLKPAAPVDRAGLGVHASRSRLSPLGNEG